MNKLSFLLVLAVAVCATQANGVKRAAIAYLKSTAITGNVTFEQTGSGPVRAQAYFTGLPAGDHGFHIHEKGDISTCANAGGHYNPFGKSHGAPTASERHVGDLGNIYSDGTVAKLDITDNLLSLVGEHSILGRAVVVHEHKDDLGLGDSPDSKKTGNAGGRLACGVIGIKNPVDQWNLGKSGSPTFSVLSMAALSIVGSILTIL